MVNLPNTWYAIYQTRSLIAAPNRLKWPRRAHWCLLCLFLVGLTAGAPLALSAQNTQTLFLPLVSSPNLIVSTFEDELNSDGDCSLREAIVAANSHSTVDACQGATGPNIILLPIGVYPILLAGAHEDVGATGDFDITSDLTIVGEDIQSTQIDGRQLDRVLHVHANSKVTISKVTLHHGKTVDGADSETDAGVSAESGAGIANFGRLTLNDVVLSDHVTGQGGAGQAGDPEEGKTGGNGGSGGAIYNNGELILRRSTITKNQTGNGGTNGFNACQGNAGAGGGLLNDYEGILTVIDSTISHNLTGTGAVCKTKPNFVNGGTGGEGGGLMSLGIATIVTSVIHGNRTGNGGEVSAGSATGGSGGRGGGIFNHGELHLTNSTVSNNQTGKGGNASRGGNGGNGGGIVTNGLLTFNHVTLTNNRTGRGGVGSAEVTSGAPGSAGGLFSTSNPDGVFARNTIIAGNSSARSWPDCGATIDSLGYNLIGDVDGCKLTGDLTGNLTNRDPRLVALADNGGPTWTHALPAGSAALNAGSCTDSSGSNIPFDQRGRARPKGSTCDMGAFEAE